MNVILELIAEQSGMALKAVRLAALKDAPTAFESRYENEKLMSDADWVLRAGRWSAPGSTAYLARHDGTYCGVAAGTLDQSDETRAYLLSMWVSPHYRQQKIGQMLVAAIIDWARHLQLRELVLDVTSDNEVAIRFYESLGFTMTGNQKPYVNDPSLHENEMSLRL